MAEDITLVAQQGRPIGSRPAGRLRAEGKVPAVLYGHGVEPTALAVDHRALRAALNTDAGLNALLDLDVEGTHHLAMARQLQRNPIKGTLDHVDFVVVRRDEVVTIEVPVHLVGDADQVVKNDGVVDQQVHALTVHAKPGDIPGAIEVDISALAIGDTIRVGDVKLPSGVTTDLDPEDAVVIGQPPQVTEADLVTEADVAAAETAAEEAAAAEGEDGSPQASTEGSGGGDGAADEG